MCNYGIIIPDEETCKRVMKLLRTADFEFETEPNENDKDCFEIPHLRIINEEGKIYTGEDINGGIYQSLVYARSDDCIIITANEFLNNPEIISYWKDGIRYMTIEEVREKIKMPNLYIKE